MTNDEPIYASMSERELRTHINTLELLIDLDHSSPQIMPLIRLRELAKSYLAEKTGEYPLSRI